jgi:hypothetical protein
MKKAIFGVILAVIVACSFSGCGKAEAQTAHKENKGKVNHWEYTSVTGGGLKGCMEKANKLGGEGWEIVLYSEGVLVFKRKIP